MKGISIGFLASQLNIFSKGINDFNKTAYAKELVRNVINVLNYRDGDSTELLYEIGAQWERNLNSPTITELFLGVYKEIKQWANINGYDPRICFKIVEIGEEFFVAMDLDLTFETMKRLEEEANNTEVTDDSIIDNPTVEQMENITAKNFYSGDKNS